MKRYPMTLVLLGTLAAPALAQMRALPGPLIVTDHSGLGCSGGLQYDDGTFENGYGWLTSTLFGQYVMKFDLPGAGTKIDAVCVCWRGVPGGSSSVNFNLYFWDANGSGGGPGTRLAVSDALTASAVPTSGAQFYRFELDEDVFSASDAIYIGAGWFPSLEKNVFLCGDESLATPEQPAYGGTSVVLAPAAPLGTGASFPNYRAVGLRAEVTEPSCVPSPQALCLNGGRFEVTATFETAGGQSGDAQVVKLTDETGYLWFFSASNVEAVVKVLDACGLNDRFWVFAGGLTDVRTVITVTDTETGTVKTYTNPQGKAFQPIQDTSALATCP
jgi:hypothetical protein